MERQLQEEEVGAQKHLEKGPKDHTITISGLISQSRNWKWEHQAKPAIIPFYIYTQTT